jgi:hypothetical protein
VRSATAEANVDGATPYCALNTRLKVLFDENPASKASSRMFRRSRAPVNTPRTK